MRFDHVIVGAGAIGLSIAFELSKRGGSVCVLDRGQIGKQTSWAAAGILPAVPSKGQGRDAFESFRYASGRMFPTWLDRIQQHTDINPEYDSSGGIHLAAGPAEAAALRLEIEELRELGLEVENLNVAALGEHEPAIAAVADRLNEGSLFAAYRMADEAVLRPPRYLAAMTDACRQLGVTFLEQVEIEEWRNAARLSSRIHSLRIKIEEIEEIEAETFCVATGVWSGEVGSNLDLMLDVRPWRGQMLLLEGPVGLFEHVINEGPKYLVPRRDGKVLIGSTVEDVGFDVATTDDAIDDLHAFAGRWIPQLSDAKRIHRWAGLRPGSGDGWPYLGRTQRWDNVYVATGHFRSGIFLSPITAKTVGELIYESQTTCDISDFRLERK